MFDTQSAFRMEAGLVNEAGQIAAATCGFLDKLAAFDDSMAWDPEGGCVFPGCGNTRFTHAHHIEHWANGGETSLSNLASRQSIHLTCRHTNVILRRDG